MSEMQLVLARTLYRFDLRRAEGNTTGEGRPELGWGMRDPGTFQLRDAYISVKEGPFVQLKRRE